MGGVDLRSGDLMPLRLHYEVLIRCMVHYMIWVIHDRLWESQNRQKSCTNRRLQALKFGVGDSVFLQISLRKGVIRFEKRGKLILKNICQFEILLRFEDLAYELPFPQVFSAIHPMFHVSMLQRYSPNVSHILW